MASTKPSLSTATNGHSSIDIETPILIVGGGPVGMITALMLARIHGQRSTIIERESTSTTYPKMEYSNGRSMEIYRKLGLANALRELGNTLVSDDYTSDQMLATSLAPGGKLIHKWSRSSPNQMREKSRSNNDGSEYLEPHMRCHQIALEDLLKKQIESEWLIQSHWGTTFEGLEEGSDSVVCTVKKADGSKMRIKSQYLIGCDGGGSLVRKAIGQESKRKYMGLNMAFAHFRSKSLRRDLPVPRFWHSYVVRGEFGMSAVVSQNEDDLWTCHLMLDQGVDGSTMSTQELVDTAIGGCQGPKQVDIDHVYARGAWKSEVGVAESFRSSGGRVFLAGDAAHQMSPMGGHGLNTGVGDAFDLSWKLAAVLKGWAGDKLLDSYHSERMQIAVENTGHVQRGYETIMAPLLEALQIHSKEALNADSSDGEEARAVVGRVWGKGYWLHNQNGNILGYSYKESPVIIEEQEKLAYRPVQVVERNTPSTWPGFQSPRVWMKDGRHTVDTLSPSSFNLIDFSKDGELGSAFAEAAARLDIPLQMLKWPRDDANLRSIYERDLVLVRPDTHIAWRCAVVPDRVISLEEATRILRTVTGRTE